MVINFRQVILQLFQVSPHFGPKFDLSAHQRYLLLGGKQVVYIQYVAGKRRSGLMVSRSTPEQVVWVQALARAIELCSWAKHFTLRVALSIQVY